MSTSLAEFVRIKGGFPPLRKVDLLDHEVKSGSKQTSREKLGQAAIPATLAALHWFTRTEKGSQAVLTNNSEGKRWLEVTMETEEKSTIHKVAEYAGVNLEEAAASMEAIASEAVLAIREAVAHLAAPGSIFQYMREQRQAILVYLPAALHLEKWLDNRSQEDHFFGTDSPVLNLLHRIGNKFSLVML